MKTRHSIFCFSLLALSLSCSLAAVAQTVTRTSYFMENSTHKHLMNPALVPSRGYLSLPVLGELYLGLESNLKFTNFIYPALPGETELRTFLHKSIDADDFLTALGGDQNLRMDMRTSLFSFGYYAGKSSFITFDLGTRFTTSLNLPYDLFGFLKKGMSSSTGNTYHLDNLMVGVDAIAEAALGYSVNLTRSLRLGVKGKFLAGGGRVKAGIKSMEVEMTPDQWTITTNGELDVYGQGLTLSTDDQGNMNFGVNYQFSPPGLGGMGMAFDLGFDWSPIRNLDISLGVIDIGGIKWKKENIIHAASSGTATFSGIGDFKVFGNDSQDGGTGSTDQLLEDLTDDLMKMAEFKQTAVTEDNYQRLTPIVNAGLEYSLRRISLGALMTKRLSETNPYTEYMVALNLKPVRWFNLSGSYSLLHGESETVGFALGFVPGIINIFLACDYVYWNMTPQFIPLNTSTVNFQLGASIPLGKGRYRGNR